MSELESLRLYKADAIEALEENERTIKSMKERIQVLEFHLTKLRDLNFHGWQATAGVVPLGATAIEAPLKRAKKK